MSVFWRWWVAGTSSDLGSAVGGVALPLTALTVLEATPFEMGLIAASGYIAWIVIGLPAGVIVQRLPLRGAQVGADLVRAVAVASIPAAWWFGLLTVAHLVVVALILSFAHVIFFVANTTFLPEIVDRDQLQSRNSLTSGTHATTQLAGPSLGGFAVQLLGAVPTLLVDAVSYLVSAAVLRTLPARRGRNRDRHTPMGAMIREGWAFVTRHPMMGPAMWSATASNFVNGAYLALFPLYLVRDLHAPAAVVGVLLAVDGVGTLIGAALTTRITNALGTARGLIILGFVEAAGAFVIPAATGRAAYVTFTVGVLIFAGTGVVFSVTTRTYRQIASPPELLSRVMATVRFVSWGAIPVGGLVAGALAGPLGARATLLIFAVAAVLAPLALLLSPVRGRRDLLDPAVTEREAVAG
ncbi:MFS transporter [Actinoplanes sp. NPDC049118]|uniref:MFS transporter n=1 Tax=Actinoplanes sp. NPDC049118 TaxID=3155769 RepID=UPI0033E874AF